MNWTGKLASYFIENGKLTFLLTLALFVAGIFSFFLTPKKYNPTIVAPAFQVVVTYPGASKQEVIEHVTKPLENIISNITGVEDIYSVTRSGGSSILNVNFFVGEDFDKAKINLNDRIQSNIDLIPLGVLKPVIKSIDPDDVPVLTIHMGSDSLTPIELRKQAFKIKDQLGVVKDTGIISVYGGKQRELSITVNQSKLIEKAVSVKHIEEALLNNNIYSTIGNIKNEKSYLPLEIDGRVRTVQEIENIIVISNDSIRLTVGDIAKVNLSEVESDSEIRHSKQGKQYKSSVLISVTKLKDTNISEVTEAVHETIHNFPENKDFVLDVIVDQGRVASNEINGLLTNLFSSIAIVVFILIFFLNLKSAILVAIAIPLTLSSVFIAAYLGGQSINRITLFALILSLGLLVDNATVVIENITRKLSESKKPSKALFAEAVNEVGLGLFMSTLTTVLAFLPMAFIGGMMGPYMGPIPFFVPAALVIALGISYSINPWMASIIMHKKIEAKENSWTLFGKKFLLKYRHLLRGLLSSKKKSSVFLGSIVLVLILSASLPAFYLVKFRMLPKANVNQFYMYLDLPAGSSFEKTLQVTKQMEAFLLKNKNIEMTQSYVSTAPILDFNGLFKNVSARRQFHQSTIRVGLIDKEKRDENSEQIVIKLRRELSSNELFTNVKLKLIEDPPGPPVMSTYMVRLEGPEEVIRGEVENIRKLMKRTDGIVDIDTTMPEDSYTFHLQIDHDAANKSNISPHQIMSTLSTLYEGKVVGLYHDDNNIEQEFIKIRFDKESRIDSSTLDKIEIFNQYRIGVPLSKLVKTQKILTTPIIYRENEKNVIYLTAEMGERSVTYAGIDTLISLLKYKLTSDDAQITNWDLFGVDYLTQDGQSVRISIGGEWELTLEVFRDLILAMLVAIMVIYFVLIAQFKSFSDPLIIMSTIPLSVIGVFPGFMVLNFVQGEFFTATSMIGIIALAGIAVNNSIILLEYLKSMKGNSVSLIEALIDACATRLRPIALTTITTVLGSMTILGDPVWAGLAWAIVLGLAVSSVLILFVFPVLYYKVHSKRV